MVKAHSQFQLDRTLLSTRHPLAALLLLWPRLTIGGHTFGENP
jgi:hypothetical protein